jgi:hypothetical protein
MPDTCPICGIKGTTVTTYNGTCSKGCAQTKTVAHGLSALTDVLDLWARIRMESWPKRVECQVCHRSFVLGEGHVCAIAPTESGHA